MIQGQDNCVPNNTKHREVPESIAPNEFHEDLVYFVFFGPGNNERLQYIFFDLIQYIIDYTFLNEHPFESSKEEFLNIVLQCQFF